MRALHVTLEEISLNQRTLKGSASPTGFELESTKTGDKAEELDVIDISKLNPDSAVEDSRRLIDSRKWR